MKKLLHLLSLNIEFTDNVSSRRILLISAILLFSIFTFVFFALFNSLVLNNQVVSVLDVIAAGVSIYTIYHLKKYKNLSFAAKLATINLMFFFLTFIYVNGSSHFALIWTIFLPMFATLTNGKYLGLAFSVVFYALLYALAYINIDIWSEGNWLLQDWLRLVFSSIILTFVMYMNESALEESDRRLNIIRESEKQHIQELKELSITDQLTGLYNRRHYNDMLPKLISLAKRNNCYITFFILDIDYFKNYNDHYGHIKGDEALIEVSHAIKNHIQRGDDFVFRLGGEEFAGIIISDNKNKTHEWVMSICKIIEDLKIEHVKSDISQYITASIGISTIAHEREYNMDNLYAFADEALYTAKHDGRNRSELSTMMSA